jgi:hypothetical protein
MIHEIAGHTFYLRNVVCLHPLFRETPSRAELKVMTTGGPVAVILEGSNLASADKLVSDFVDALWIQSDEDKGEQ